MNVDMKRQRGSGILVIGHRRSSFKPVKIIAQACVCWISGFKVAMSPVGCQQPTQSAVHVRLGKALEGQKEKM